MFLERYMYFFFFKQKTAYEMRISDWSSDVCSSDLCRLGRQAPAEERAKAGEEGGRAPAAEKRRDQAQLQGPARFRPDPPAHRGDGGRHRPRRGSSGRPQSLQPRSGEVRRPHHGHRKGPRRKGRGGGTLAGTGGKGRGAGRLEGLAPIPSSEIGRASGRERVCQYG